MAENARAKTGKSPSDIPRFSNCTCCEICFKDNKHISLHLAQIDAQMEAVLACVKLTAIFTRVTLSKRILKR